MPSRIYFFKENIQFRFQKRAAIEKWIARVIKKESKKGGEINFIFCTDQHLLEINKRFLRHSYYTDIVTFDYSEGNLLVGDVFISIDRVKENAQTLGLRFHVELCRVIIHGVLHLAGYSDKTKALKEAMRKKEDACLSLLPSSTWN